MWGNYSREKTIQRRKLYEEILYLEIVIWILVILNWNATSNQLWLPFAKCFDMLSAKITRQKSVFEIWRQIIYLLNEYPQNKIPLNILANSSIGISSFPIIESQQSKNMKVSSENIKWKHILSDKWKTRTNGLCSMIARSQPTCGINLYLYSKIKVRIPDPGFRIKPDIFLRFS